MVLSSGWSGDICGEERGHHTSSASKAGASIWKFGKLRPVTAEGRGLVLVLIRHRPWLGYLLGLFLVAPPSDCPPRSGCALGTSQPQRSSSDFEAPTPDTAGIQAEIRGLYRRQVAGSLAESCVGGQGRSWERGLNAHLFCTSTVGFVDQRRNGTMGALALPLLSSKGKKSPVSKLFGV